MQQHNNWGKDRDLLAEAYSDTHDQAKVRPEEDVPPQHQDENIGIGEDGEGSNIYERLEEFMETVDDDTVDYLRQILTDFEAIITDINALEAPDQKIAAVDLGIHLNRLAPFSNM